MINQIIVKNVKSMLYMVVMILVIVVIVMVVLFLNTAFQKIKVNIAVTLFLVIKNAVLRTHALRNLLVIHIAQIVAQMYRVVPLNVTRKIAKTVRSVPCCLVLSRFAAIELSTPACRLPWQDCD